MFYISRFKDVEKMEYVCEVVTPMFLGGAEPRDAELRVPSVKGSLRFWWRAGYDGSDIKKMMEKEADIFGSTDQKSRLKIMIDSTGIKPVLKDLPAGTKVEVVSKQRRFAISIIEYLAFGLFDPQKNQGKYIRQYIEPGSRFKIIIICPNDFIKEINNAFKAMFLCGGLGSRARNGFGSIHCSNLSAEDINSKREMKSFTAFSKEAKLFRSLNKHGRWEEALSEIGIIYRNARLSLEKRHEFIKRGLIAMPIESKFERNIPKAIKEGRHAKPYFLHINKTSDGKFQGQILFLPYLYKTKTDDSANRLEDYRTACVQMNEEIARGMGGVK